MILTFIENFYNYYFKPSKLLTYNNEVLSKELASIRALNTILRGENTKYKNENQKLLNENLNLQKQIDIFNINNLFFETIINSYKNLYENLDNIIPNNNYYIELINPGANFLYNSSTLSGFIHNNKFYFKAPFLIGKNQFIINNTVYDVIYTSPRISTITSMINNNKMILHIQGTNIGNDDNRYNIIIQNMMNEILPISYEILKYTESEISIQFDTLSKGNHYEYLYLIDSSETVKSNVLAYEYIQSLVVIDE
jgi:hypothetical protein